MIHRRVAEPQRLNQISDRVIGCAIDVHRSLGPGLLESAYEECLSYELIQSGFSFQRQLTLPLIYKEIRLDCGYRIDLLVEELIVLELKTVEMILPVHEAQLITYLKLTGCPIGLIINFNVPLFKDGIRRLVYNFPDSSAPQRLRGE